LQPDSFWELGILACCEHCQLRIRQRRSFFLNDRPQTFWAETILIFIGGSNMGQLFTPTLLFSLSATGKSSATV
jgi:hypothetical protein